MRGPAPSGLPGPKETPRNLRRESGNDRGTGSVKTVRGQGSRRRPELCGAARPGDRLPRAERRGQDHDHAHGAGSDFNAAEASLTGQVALGELIIVVLGALVITS